MFIFLDVDGVLWSGNSRRILGGQPSGFTLTQRAYFDWQAVARLSAVCDKTGAQCVLSSSWRHRYTSAQARRYLGLPIIDSTPSLPGGRGLEISSWLEHRGHRAAYAIVDDIAYDLLDSQVSVLVHVDEDLGFVQRDADKLLSLLQVSEAVNSQDIKPGSCLSPTVRFRSTN